MSAKTNFHDFNVQFIKLNQTHKVQNFVIISTALVLLSIPAALLFHEILVLISAISIDAISSIFVIKLKSENWRFFVFKPHYLWRAKLLLLLHSLAGSITK